MQLNMVVESYNAGITFLEKQDTNAALASFQKAIGLASQTNSADAKKVLAAAANDAGGILMMRGAVVEAERYFRQAIANNPQHALAMNNLGTSLLRQGKIAESQKAFEDSIKTNPTSSLPLNNLGEMLMEAGQLRMAAKYLVASLKANPTNQQTLLMLARVYTLSNMPKEREAVCQALSDLSGGSPTSKALLAEHYLTQGLNDRAGELLRQTLDAEPSLLLARRLTALWKAKMGNIAGAESDLRELLQQKPNDPGIRSDLATVLLDSGRTEDARTVAFEGTERFPGEAENWFVLGTCYEKLGLVEQAAAAYQHAVQAKPSHARALNNLGVLAAKKDLAKDAMGYFLMSVQAAPYYADARYNLGRALVITKTDYTTGVRLLAAVGGTKTDAGAKARAFIVALEKVVSTGSPLEDNAVAGRSLPNLESIKDHVKSPLLLAIMSGNIESTLDAIRSSTNVNEKVESGVTPLMVASSMGQTSVVKALIARGANLEAANDQGRTALMFAAFKGRAACVKALIEAGATVNIKEKEQGLSPLMCGVIGGQIEIVELLVRAKANINEQDNEGDTALIKAAVADWAPAIELLVTHGAKSQLRDKSGKTALDYARDGKCIQLLKQAANR